MKFTPKRGLLLTILVLAGIVPLVMTLRSEPKLQEPLAPGVEVVPVIQKDVPIYREWIGTLDGMVNAAIKAQVTDYPRSSVQACLSWPRADHERMSSWLERGSLPLSDLVSSSPTHWHCRTTGTYPTGTSSLQHLSSIARASEAA